MKENKKREVRQKMPKCRWLRLKDLQNVLQQNLKRSREEEEEEGREDMLYIQVLVKVCMCAVKTLTLEHQM